MTTCFGSHLRTISSRPPLAFAEQGAVALLHGDAALERRERLAYEHDALDVVLADDVAADPGVGGERVQPADAQQVEALLVVLDHDQLDAAAGLEHRSGQ